MMRFVPILAVINMALGICAAYVPFSIIADCIKRDLDVIQELTWWHRQPVARWDLLICLLAFTTGVFYCFRTTHRSRVYGPTMLILTAIACFALAYLILDYPSGSRTVSPQYLLAGILLFIGILNSIFAISAWRRTLLTAPVSVDDDDLESVSV